MKFYVGLLVLASMLAYSVSSAAIELELIPGSFPADQKPAFARERAALTAEKKALDRKVYSYNKRCGNAKPYQAHQCNTDRLALFKLVDAYKNKVEDFNKRLGVIDRGSNKKTDNKTATEGKGEDGHE